MLNGFKNIFRRLFRGRNGMDRLSLMLILFFFVIYPIKYIGALGGVFLGIAIFRMFSKDVAKRRMELQQYNQIIYRYTSKFKVFAFRKKYGKDYKYLKCKNCKENLKVPKGKGMINVTCPKCGSVSKIKS